VVGSTSLKRPRKEVIGSTSLKRVRSAVDHPSTNRTVARHPISLLSRLAELVATLFLLCIPPGLVWCWCYPWGGKRRYSVETQQSGHAPWFGSEISPHRGGVVPAPSRGGINSCHRKLNCSYPISRTPF